MLITERTIWTPDNCFLLEYKEDWDTEDQRTKAVMSVDGKVVDKGSLVVLVKKSS